MPEPSLSWHSLLVPKEGHSLDECEDAVRGNTAAGRFAIADGATESYAAGDWARLLVDAFVSAGPIENWLGKPRMAWKQQTGSQAVSWYAEDKFKLGAHATFLGLTVASGEWSAIAAGDVCLFVLSRGSLLKTFPMTHSSEFSTTPSLVTSRSGPANWKEDRGLLAPGDTLLLATDALAQMLLASAEAGKFAGNDLTAIDNEDDFSLWVAMMRSSGRLRNDDVAVGVVQ
ncbi:MAG: hypothetical protein EXS09_17610 [Gemmataceae bacterium]|nr:hypothetical protein [Gemmataceae bacterium]